MTPQNNFIEQDFNCLWFPSGGGHVYCSIYKKQYFVGWPSNHCPGCGQSLSVGDLRMGLSQRRLGYLREIEERETGEIKLIFDREHILIQPEDKKILEEYFIRKLIRDNNKEKKKSDIPAESYSY